MYKRLLSVAALIILAFTAGAQQTGNNEPSGAMVSNGKIYVVLFVCLVILAGLIGYLFMLDRKISKMEKQKD